MLAFTGCAKTKFYKNGQLVMDTQADIIGLTITEGGSIQAASIGHSQATRAGVSWIAPAATGIGGIITTWKLP
jgi:hypothetical protein